MIKIALAQYPITPCRSFDEWRGHTEAWIDAASGAQLAVFPEYGAMELTHLFSEAVRNDLQAQMEALQGLHDDFVAVYSELATRSNMTLVAPSLPVWEKARFVNRAYVLYANGGIAWQDKWRMTRFEAESWGVSSGDLSATVFETDWGRFGVQICYDIEFPEGAKALCGAGAQLIVAPSCTETLRGATRVHVGARARALENQCYVAVAQTVGEALWSPAVDINYGYGALYGPPDTGFPEDGVVALGRPQAPEWLLAEIDLDKVVDVRINGQVLNYRDQDLGGEPKINLPER